MIWENGGMPAGWTRRVLGDVTKVVGGGTPKTSDAGNFSADAGHPWITPADLTGYTGKYIGRGRRFLTDRGLAGSSATYMPAGTVLFSSRAPIGYVAIAKNPVTTNQGFRSFVPSKALDSEYLYYALRFLKPVAEELASGTTFPELSGKAAATIPIALPPLGEQRSIARILDKLEDSCRRAAQRIEEARQAVRQFRESLLTSACSGDLTADWRETVQPLATPKLSPTRAARRQFRDLEQFDLGEIPPEWRWVQLDDVLRPDGLFDGPFGSNLKGSDYIASGARVVRLENVGRLTFIDSKRSYVSRQKYGALRRHAVYAGDIIFSSFIVEATRVCILPDDLHRETLAKADCFTIRPNEVVRPAYLVLQLASMRSFEFLRSEVHGVTRPRVNTTQLRNLPIPICTLEEQDEIVRRFTALVRRADELTARIDGTRRRVEQTTQAVLAKAFRGELTLNGAKESNA